MLYSRCIHHFCVLQRITLFKVKLYIFLNNLERVLQLFSKFNNLGIVKVSSQLSIVHKFPNKFWFCSQLNTMSAARWRHSKPPPIFDHFRRTTATCFSFFCAWANTGKLSQTLCLFSILLPLWSSWKEYNDQTHHKNVGKLNCSVRIFSSPFNFPFAVLSQVKKIVATLPQQKKPQTI